MLRAEAVSAGYGGKTAISGVSLEVECGEIVGMVGHNGAGKTTILRALIGLMPISAGRIAFGSREVKHGETAALVREGLGFVPQGANIFPTSVSPRTWR